MDLICSIILFLKASRFFLFFFMYINGVCVCVCVCVFHALCLLSSEEGVTSPGTGVRTVVKHLVDSGCGGLNMLGP